MITDTNSTAETATTAAGHEHLMTGWEPDVPLDDTLVRHYAFALSASSTGPAAALGGRVLEREDVIAADLGRPNGVGNAAVLIRPPGTAGWPATVDVLDGFFAEGTGRAYLFSPWPTPDLTDRGWELEGHPPLLVRPPGLPPPTATSDLEVREVVDDAGLADLERVLVDGFPFDELQPFSPGAWLDHRVLGLPGHRWFVGYEGGAAVTAGWLHVHTGLASLVLGATLPEHRGRGCWTAMVRARLAAAPGLPAAALFGDLSRPIAQRHGFVPVTRFTAWHRDR